MDNANIERDKNAINTSKRPKWKAGRLTKNPLYASKSNGRNTSVELIKRGVKPHLIQRKHHCVGAISHRAHLEFTA
ncbi:hypothetical protein P20652_1221 [Pseudoalteromonas sp. BSi20652]|nr:hypothetical protein P20652_1221 [Pseudoalteromonas sp. BSi20652]